MRYTARALKQLRSRKGWTRHELARRAGIERKTVEYLERGVTTPTARTLAKLCTALGANPNEFFTNGDRL